MALCLYLITQSRRAMNKMGGFIRSLQLLLHIPLFLYSLPSNVSMFIQTTLPIAMFDLLGEIIDFENLPWLPMDLEKQKELGQSLLPSQIVDVGYETRNSILNLGTLGLVTMLLVAKILIAVPLIFYSKMSSV